MAGTSHRHQCSIAAIALRLAFVGALSSVALAFSAASPPTLPASASQPTAAAPTGVIQIGTASTLDAPGGNLHTGG